MQHLALLAAGVPPPFWSVATLLTIAKVVAGIAVFFGSATVLWKAPVFGGVVRWVGHRLIGDPLSGWATARLSEAVHEAVDNQSVVIGRQLGAVHVAIEDEAALRAADRLRLQAVEKQLTRNGGGSVKDAVDRIERRLDRLGATVDREIHNDQQRRDDQESP